MILFYNLRTGHVIGHVEGRVHHSQHFDMLIYDDVENKKEDIETLVIGYEDTGEVEEFTDDQGRQGIQPIVKPHNLHLWDHQLALEDPKSEVKPHHLKVVKENGSVVDLIKQ